MTGNRRSVGATLLALGLAGCTANSLCGRADADGGDASLDIYAGTAVSVRGDAPDAADGAVPDPCGNDPRVGTACDPQNPCETGTWRCVGRAVSCVGNGTPRVVGTQCRGSA